MNIERIETDLLIVGSGFAGLWAAIAAREAGVGRVAVVDKAAIAMSSQSRLCAGATIYCLPEDDLEAWLRDFVEAVGFLSRQPMISEIFETSYARLCKLEEWGVHYQEHPSGEGYFRLPSRGLNRVLMMVRPRFGDRFGGSAVIDAVRRRPSCAAHSRRQAESADALDEQVCGTGTASPPKSATSARSVQGPGNAAARSGPASPS